MNVPGRPTTPTLCRLCSSNCGVDADGATYHMMPMPGHPRTRLCAKARLAPWVAASSRRLLHPLKNTASGWRRISWDEALSLLASRIEQYLPKQPESVAVYLGEAVGHVEIRNYARRLANLIGTPNFATSSSICFQVRNMAALTLFGRLPYPDYSRARAIVVWGSNPAATRPPEAADIALAHRAGATLIVIDPRRTRLAAGADIHLQPAPGTDGILALGLVREVMRRDRVAAGRDQMYGLDEAADAVCKFDRDTVTGLTGITGDELDGLASLLSPDTAYLLGNGLEHSGNAFDNIRSIYMLMAISGAIGGGAMKWGGDAGLSDLSGKSVSRAPAIGADRHPLYCASTGEAQALSYVDAIETGDPYPLRMMIVQGGNPVATWPDTNRTLKALGRLEFLAVMDLFMSETAQQADLVLPAAWFLERSGFHYYPELNWLSLRRPAARPPGECRPDWWLWFELARRFDRAWFPWATNDEAIRDMMPADLDQGRLLASPQGIAHAVPDDRGRPYRTPSGRIELVSDMAATYGLPSLPRPRAPIGQGMLLSTGARSPLHVHSRFVHITQFRERDPFIGLELHPGDARARGVVDGSEVCVRTGTEELKVQALVTDSVRAGMCHLAHGWPAAQANVLTGGAAIDRASGFPAVKEVRCEVTAAVDSPAEGDSPREV